MEQEETAAKNEELQAKVKTLEQENLAKEHEITSLSPKNQLLETEVEKLESGVKDAKKEAEAQAGHGTQNESLQRRLQLLEEEAEESDKNIRETNEKYAHPCRLWPSLDPVSSSVDHCCTDYDKQMSKLATTNARFRLWRPHAINGRRNTKRCPRSMRRSRRSWKTFNLRLATFDGQVCTKLSSCCILSVAGKRRALILS